MTIKGHAKQRAREWRKLGRDPAVEQTGRINEAGWKQAAAKFGEMGWSVARGGEQLVTA